MALKKPASQPTQPSQPTQSTGTKVSLNPASATNEPEPSAQEFETVTADPVAPSIPKVPNLSDMLKSLTPEQRASLREMTAGEGLSVATPASNRKNSDGSLDVTIHLDAETVTQLEIWSEADGCNVVEEAQKRIGESLQNYLYGDWSTPEPEPVPVPVVPVAAAAAPAAAPAATTK